MKITGTARFATFRRAITSFSSWSERVGLAAMGAMVLAALVDVIGSKGFRWPLPGSTELTGVLQVVAIAGGLAFSKLDGRQIRVDLFIDWLPRRGKAILEIFISILSLALFVVAGWTAYKYGLRLLGNGTQTLLLGIPLYPFTFWIAFCCIPMCFVILVELLDSIEEVFK